jgi:hypothetical protein
VTSQEPYTQPLADPDLPDTEVILVEQPAPVFVDSTGRRRRLLRRFSYAFGAFCMVYGGLISVSLAGGPVSPNVVLPLPGLIDGTDSDWAEVRPTPTAAPTVTAPRAVLVNENLPRRAATPRHGGVAGTRSTVRPSRSTSPSRSPSASPSASVTPTGTRPVESTKAPTAPPSTTAPGVTRTPTTPPTDTSGTGGGSTSGDDVDGEAPDSGETGSASGSGGPGSGSGGGTAGGGSEDGGGGSEDAGASEDGGQALADEPDDDGTPSLIETVLNRIDVAVLSGPSLKAAL